MLPAESPVSQPANRPIRVLIVEDVDSMRQLMEWVLKEDGSSLESELGIQVSGLAKNTWEARLEISRECPDLVLLDEILPGESSIDLLNELSQAGIPVLLVTSMENRDSPIPQGASGRLQKPGWKTVNQDRTRFQQAIRQVIWEKFKKAD